MAGPEADGAGQPALPHPLSAVSGEEGVIRQRLPCFVPKAGVNPAQEEHVPILFAGPIEIMGL